VTKLSLLLKVLEDESNETIGSQLALFQERVLPDLGKNIKCGNSLIAPDYWDGQFEGNEGLGISDEEKAKVNAFDWKAAFPDVFAQGGFDAVIGNPPYRKERESKELLADLQKSNYGKKYYQGKMDFWYFFLHLAIDITKEGGLISFITPSYWLSSTGSSKLIVRVKETCTFLNAVNFSKNKIFDHVSGNHMVYVLLKKLELDDSKVVFQKFIANNLSGNEIKSELENSSTFSKIEIVQSSKVFTNDGKIDFTISNFSSIIDKLSSDSFPLEGDEKIFEVSQGLVEAPDSVSQAMADKAKLPDLVGEGVFVIPKTIFEKIRFTELEKKFIKPYLRLHDVKKYRYSFSGFHVFYIGNQDNKEILQNRAKYPHIVEHLDKYKKIITSSNAPYGIHRTREQRFFTVPKVIGANMFDKPSFTYCEEEYYVNFGFNVIVGHSAIYDLRYLTGIVNSNVGAFWFNLYGKKRGVNNDVGVGVLRTFPVHAINFTDPADKARHGKMVSLVERILELHKRNPRTPQEKESLAGEIASVDRSIDELVYQLYGLSEEEIKIVEGK
jgi:adenine-specific DNA-methyltransferase